MPLPLGLSHSIAARGRSPTAVLWRSRRAFHQALSPPPVAPRICFWPAPTPSPRFTVVTFTATLGGVTITPIGPSGTVAFTARGNPITCSSPATVNATGVATCTTSSLDAGTDSIGASYPGDGNYKTANASTINQTVKALTPTLGLSAAP